MIWMSVENHASRLVRQENDLGVMTMIPLSQTEIPTVQTRCSARYKYHSTQLMNHAEPDIYPFHECFPLVQVTKLQELQLLAYVY